ncbi:hypothetical protein Nmel_003802 [Mimus melanotis]
MKDRDRGNKKPERREKHNCLSKYIESKRCVGNMK